MTLRQNIIYIYFKGKHQVTSKSQYQYNRKQYLYFADLNLPQVFEVHFSNKNRGESKTQIGSDKLVEIPDEYFWSGALEIYVWVYLHSGTDDGETIYEVKIPLIKRAKPTDEEPLPVQQSAIDKAIAELNNAVDVTNENADKTNADKTQVATIKEEVVTLKEEIDSTASAVSQDAQSARESADASEQSAQNSAESERKALDYSDEAKGYAQSALESKDTASQKAQIATDASAEAKGYRDEAETFKNEAEQAKQNIVDYRDETKGYRDETLNLKNTVQTLKNQADETAEEIKDTSDAVKEDAQSASQSASSANQSSINASESASQAGRFADGAEQSANQAEQSMNTTEDYKNQSETFKNQAEEFKNQTETNVSHYPKIVNDYWYIWDATNREYVNTNVDANGIKGDTGRGIASITLNDDYTLTITFTDDTTYTTSSIRGQQGEKGDTGESGVYIGTEEPENEDIKVWIDSDDDGTSEDLVKSIESLKKNIYKPYVTDSASGSIPSFPDGADDIPLKSLVVNIDPVQDLHGYDAPWVGGGGSNKWDEQWEVGSLNSNTGLPVDSTTLIRSKNFCECSPSTEYAKVCSPTSYVNVFWYDENQAFISLSGGGGSNSYSVITSPSNAKYFKIRTESAYGTAYKNDIAINYPYTVTTYSPYENICPISGWTGVEIQRDGKNLWGGNITEHPSGKRVSGYGATGGYPKLNKCINPNTYTISVICNLPSGETPEDWAKSYNIRTWFKSAIDGKWYEFPEGNYSELRLSTSVGSKLFTYTTPPNISVTPTEFVSKPFELTIPVSCIALGFYKNGKYLEYTSIQLEVGNTASDIEAYKGNSIPINWQSEAGTVYGGKLDVLSGVLRGEWTNIDLATLVGWMNNMVGQNAIEVRCALTGKKEGRTNIISNILQTGTETSAIDTAVFSVRGYPTSSTIAVKVPKTVAQDSSEAVAWVRENHPMACYELAEPIEIQLTPQQVNSLLGANNIWADTGDTAVEYRADTKLYIDKKIAEALASST